MPWNLLLFPLLGGYLFIHSCHLYRYRSRRLEGERLLLQSASWGVLFLVLARLATFYACWFDWGKYLQSLLAQLVRVPNGAYLGTAIAALLFGFLAAHAANLLLGLAEKPPFRMKPLKLRVVERYDNGLLRFFHEAMYMDHPVSVTLSNRKVYIGYVAEPPSDSPHDSFFTLLLLLSGYRDQSTLSMVQTVNYADKMELDDETKDVGLAFFVTLSMDNIVSANFFDLAIYRQYFVERQMVL